MLEKIDLVQIGKLFDDRLKSVDSQLKSVDSHLKSVDSQLVYINKSLKTLDSQSRKTNRDIDIIIRTFDNEYLGLRKRVDLIEEKVGIVN